MAEAVVDEGINDLESETNAARQQVILKALVAFQVFGKKEGADG